MGIINNITIINSGLLVSGRTAPIGPLIIASVLRENGFMIKFRDYQCSKLDRKFSATTFKTFIDDNSEVILISATCNSLPMILEASILIKSEYPDKFIILGGAGPSSLAVEIMEKYPIDYVVVGEGEISTLKLIKAINENNSVDNIDGIVYRKFNKVLKNPRQARIKNLSEVPLPAYDLVDMNQYDRVSTILTARGCPFDCKFCSANTIWQRHMTYRSVKDIVNEIKMILEYTDVIAIADDTFVLNKDRAFEIISAIKAEGIDLPWTCNGKISLMDKEWLEFMSKTNCIQVFYGIEAGSNKVLQKIGKGHTIEEARKVIDETSKYIKNTRTSYIWGYPFETIEDFYDLVDALYKDMQIKGVISQMSLLSPLHSSQLYKEYGDTIEFRIDAQSRAGGLPVEEQLENYPEMINVIKKHPDLYSSYYYYRHKDFDKKLSAIKKIDWIYSKKNSNS